jgi:hypothetical protein
MPLSAGSQSLYSGCRLGSGPSADSSELSTLVGEGSRYLWPDSYDLRRIPLRGPAPVYPLSLIWREDNSHPALSKFRDYLDTRRVERPGAQLWLPSWGQ